MSLRVNVVSEVKVLSIVAEAKASLNRAIQLTALDAKLSDLPLSRMKVW